MPTVDALEDDPRRVVDALEDESVNPNLRAAIPKLYLNDFVRALARAILCVHSPEPSIRLNPKP